MDPSGPAALPLAEQLLRTASDLQAGSEEEARLVKALRALDQRYPTATETAANAALHREESKERVAAVMEAAFSGGLRAPFLEAGTTLALAVDAASAGMRRLALEKLDALADSPWRCC